MKDLEESLASEDAEARRRGVAMLAQQNPDQRAQLLVTALGDVDWRVRKEAVRVAAEVGEGWGLLPDLVDALCQGDNVGLRNAALEVLERLGPRAANALLVALPRVPDGARKFLVAALGSAGSAGVDKLAKISWDEDPNTAQAAIESLARIGGSRAEEALRAHLASGLPVQRLAAVEGLERLGANVSVEALQPLLDDRIMRRLALGLLAYSEDPAAAEVLVGALSDTSSATAGEAIAALGRLLARGGVAHEKTAELARGLGPSERRAARTIAQSGADDAVVGAVWLSMLARDPEAAGLAAEMVADDRLPPDALHAIRHWGADAIEPFVAVQPELPERARAAALAVTIDLTSLDDGRDAHPGVLAAARRSLADPHARLASAAAQGVAQLGDGTDAAALVEVVRRNEGARSAAGRALEALAARAPDEVTAALEGVSLDGAVGAALLPAVAQCGGERAFDLLSEALNAADPRARRAALLQLPRLGGPSAVELAGFALADEDIDVQAAAVTVLGRLAAEGEGVEQLRLALRASAEPVAAGAARALGQLGDTEAAPTLRELVKEARPGVAVAALEALRTLGDDALDELLVESLGQDDVELVKESLRAIAQSSFGRRGARIALALEHSAWDVRQLAARLLGQIGGEDERAALEARAEHEEDAGVREALRGALSEESD